MIYIRIELWPRGDRSRKRLLHEAVIANDGTGDMSTADYHASLSKRGGFKCDDDRLARFDLKNVLRTAEVTGFKRKQESAWLLIKRVLGDAFKD